MIKSAQTTKWLTMLKITSIVIATLICIAGLSWAFMRFMEQKSLRFYGALRKTENEIKQAIKKANS